MDRERYRERRKAILSAGEELNAKSRNRRRGEYLRATYQGRLPSTACAVQCFFMPSVGFPLFAVEQQKTELSPHPVHECLT